MKSLARKTILITGAASGLGKCMAVGFAKEKARLALLDINPAGLETLEKSLEPMRVTAKTYVCDVSKKEQIMEAAGQVIRDFSFVDILVNNAGIVIGKPVKDTSYEEMRRIVDINLLGVMWMTRQFIGPMMAKNSGHIVNIASAAGLLAVPGLADYSATKFAVVGYSDALRMEMKSRRLNNVRVSCICPSIIDTGMFGGFKAPMFNPVLKPETVAAKIINTVKREKDYLKMPFMVKLLPLFKVLPSGLVDRLAELTGTTEAMDHFIGR